MQKRKETHGGVIMKKILYGLLGCIVLGCVWVFHLVYFIFGIKTIPAVETPAV